MDITGKIKGISRKKDSFVLNVLIKGDNYNIFSKTEFPELKKGIMLSITNLSKKRAFLASNYEMTEESLVTIYPFIRFYPEEIDYANYCKYAPLLIKFTNESEKNNGDMEKNFYNTIRGNETTDEEISKLSERFTKDIKAKFGFREYELSKKFGIFMKNTLYFSRFPTVFPGNEIKGKFQAIENKVDKYIVIDRSSGKLDEYNISTEEKKGLLNLRNEIAKIYYENSYDEILDKECTESCPLFGNCEKIKKSLNDFESFKLYFSSFLKRDRDFRKKYIKVIRTGENSERKSLEIHAIEKQSYSINAKIANNEPMIRNNEEILIIEKPPLDRKVFGKVQKILFDDMLCTSEVPTANPEVITPLEQNKFSYGGIFNLIYNESPLKELFIKNSGIREVEILQEQYIDNDEEQNAALNLIISENPFVLIRGEGGSGKKFIAKKAAEILTNNNKNVLVATDSRINEFEKYFNSNGHLKVLHLEEVYKDKQHYDNLFLFLTDKLYKESVLALAGKCEKMTVFSNKVKENLYNDEKVPETLKATLHSQHRFGKHILHFVSPILIDRMKEKEDTEIKIINKENVSPEFLPIINPEKYVQFIGINGKVAGKKNKWNKEESDLTVQIISEFIKSGVERSSIGVIVPYERQKALIEKEMEKRKITEVGVFEIDNGEEKEIIIINFVENGEIKSHFKKVDGLRMAFTRAKSKLILLGNSNTIKRDKNLGKLIKKH
jgi:energy-coupling factor transporter ATP-binding protein EcfA2